MIYSFHFIIKKYQSETVITKKNGELLNRWELKNDSLLDSVRAGGRINLIIGKSLTKKAQQSINKINYG